MLNGISYLAVIWSLLEMELPRRERREFGAIMLRQVRLGLAYVWQHRPTLWLMLLVAINRASGCSTRADSGVRERPAACRSAAATAS